MIDFKIYESQTKLMDKLELIYEIIDNATKEDRISIISEFLDYFLNKKDNTHSSEYKTILILSKSFKENNLIKTSRELLNIKYLELNKK